MTVCSKSVSLVLQNTNENIYSFNDGHYNPDDDYNANGFSRWNDLVGMLPMQMPTRIRILVTMRVMFSNWNDSYQYKCQQQR